MNKKTAKKKFYFLGFTLLFVALLLSSCGSKPTASWAEDAVKKIPELQSLPAYQKELDLEEPLSRGEAAVILNGLLNYKTASINCYVDLEDKYYKDALLKLTAAELISGDKEGKIRPEEPLTLKEGIASLAKLLSVEDKDIDSLYAAGSFKESQKDNQLTRGEFIQLLNGCVENLYNKPEEVSNKEYKNFVLVTSDNVNFSQCSFDKPVLLAPGVEEKTITFKDCTNGKTLAIKDGTVTKEDAPFRFKIASFDTK
ncbi:MAG: S-layer homology domain-containing protein, partial [Anaerovoracaceae bacterium]